MCGGQNLSVPGLQVQGLGWAGLWGPGYLPLPRSPGAFPRCAVQQSHFLHVLCVVSGPVLGLWMQRSEGRQTRSPIRVW